MAGHERQGISPEKRLEDLDGESLATLFHVNAITPVLLIQAVASSFKGRHPTIIASLSARVGSIENNRLGGWYGYRAGTTDTPLSRPFQRRVPEGKLFTPDFVAERLLAVMNDRRPEESGSFWDWAGKRIPF